MTTSSLPYRLPQLPQDTLVTGLLAQNDKDALPDGFPSQVDSPSTWSGSDLADEPHEWCLYLTPEEACCIEKAVTSFLESGQPLEKISKRTFRLPDTLSRRLDQISDKCYNGIGFCILRGLTRKTRSEDGQAVMFAGVSSHVASSRGFQDVERKNVLAHLFNVRPKSKNEYVPPSFNHAELSYHTDDGDIVALYYASFRSKGGNTCLASGNQVYNSIAATRPDLLSTLAQEWAIDRYYGPRDRPVRQMPLLHRHGDDGITLQFSRLPFSCYDHSRERKSDIPPLTTAQIEALNALQLLAIQNGFSVPAQSGDILFFNNVNLFHAREPYVERGDMSEGPKEVDRHVLRLWLQDPERTKPLAAPLQKIWNEIYGANTAAGRKESWNVKATAAYGMNAEKNG